MLSLKLIYISKRRPMESAIAIPLSLLFQINDLIATEIIIKTKFPQSYPTKVSNINIYFYEDTHRHMTSPLQCIF